MSNIRVILLAGELYQRMIKLSEIIYYTVDKATQDFNYNEFFPVDFKHKREITLSKIFSLFQTYPMMAYRRVIVIREFDNLEESTKTKVCELLLKTPETCLVIVEGLKAKLSPEPYTDYFMSVEFPNIQQDDMPNWIKDKFITRGKTINDNAIAVLIENIVFVLSRLETVIDKICINNGERKNIKAVDVLKIVGCAKLGPAETPDKLSALIISTYINYLPSIIKAEIEREKEINRIKKMVERELAKKRRKEEREKKKRELKINRILMKKLNVLAEKISTTLSDTPEDCRLLSPEMIDMLVKKKPADIGAFRKLPLSLREKIIPEEGKYIKEVIAAISEVIETSP